MTSKLIESNERQIIDIEEKNSEYSEEDTKNSLCANKQNLHNLIAVIYLQSSAGFIAYLITFYSKYFEGNFFINFTITGLSDGLSMVWINLLKKKFERKGVLNLSNFIILITTITFSFVKNYASNDT